VEGGLDPSKGNNKERCSYTIEEESKTLSKVAG